MINMFMPNKPNKKNPWPVIIFSLIAGATVKVSTASETPVSAGESIIGIEHLNPAEESRDIKTINVDFIYLISRVEKLDLSIYFSITGTYATGNITQLEGNLAAGTLRQVRHDNSAFGLGPGLVASFRFFGNNKLSAHFKGSGNFIVYNKDFPAGGDFYNFMWRIGPVLEYKIGKLNSIGISYQWVHVSNGQGIRARNPSYDAQGLGLRLSSFF